MASTQQQGLGSFGSFGFPTFEALQDLMVSPQITAARPVSIPLGSWGGTDEDSSLGILIASILGSASPGIGSALAGVLFKDEDQRTGDPSRTQALKDMLVDDLVQGEPPPTDDESRQQARFDELVDEYGSVPGTSIGEAEEIAQRILALESSDLYGPDLTALPQKKGWKRQGVEGTVNLITGGLAAAAGGRKGAEAFVTSLGASQKAQGVRDAATIDAVTTRDLARRKAMEGQVTDVLKESEGNWVLVHGLDKNNKPYARRAIQNNKGTKVESRGVEDQDLDLEGNLVPAGEFYQSPGLAVTSDAEEHATFPTLWSRQQGKVILRPGYRRLELNTDEKSPGFGMRSPVTKVLLDGEWHDTTSDKQKDFNWIPIPPGDAGSAITEAALEGFPLSQEIKDWNAFKEQERTTYGLTGLVGTVVDVAKSNPGAFTRLVGGLANLVNSGQAEISAFYELRRNRTVRFSDNSSGGAMFKGKGDHAKLLNDRLMDWAADGFSKGSASMRGVQRALLSFDEHGDIDDRIAFEGGRGTLRSFAENIDKLSANRLVLVATQLQMAYMAAAARGQTGRTLSDRDLAFFLRIVGFDATSDASNAANTAMNFLHDTITELDTNPRWSQYYGDDGQTNVGSMIRNLGGDPKIKEATLDVVNRGTGSNFGIFFDYNDAKKQWEFKKFLERAKKIPHLQRVLKKDGYYADWLFGRKLFEGKGLDKARRAVEAAWFLDLPPEGTGGSGDVVGEAMRLHQLEEEERLRQEAAAAAAAAGGNPT